MKQGKSKKHISTIVMYVGAIIVGLTAIGFLVNNVLLFNSLVDQYVSQGYSSAEVNKQLLPNQLLPGIFQAIVYLGVALLLWGAGVINKKIILFVEQKKVVESPEK